MRNPSRASWCTKPQSVRISMRRSASLISSSATLRPSRMA